MQHCDTLIAPRWCVPVAPAGGVLEGHAVAVSDGRIAAVLPLDEARARFQPSVSIERPRHVLIPGLVNAHTHAAMTLFRGLADDLPLEAWLHEGIWPAERRWVSAEMVRDGTGLAVAEMLRGGITCFSDQYFFPEIVAEVATALSVRAVVATPVADFPSAWADNATEYLQKGADLVHDPYADHPLIATAFAPHSTLSLSDESLSALRVLADQLDARVQIHLHESAAEVEVSLRDTGKRPFERLAGAGLVNRSLLAVHAVHLTGDELRQFAEAGVCIAHCPNSNLKLAGGIAPVDRYLKAGLNVALGTDGAASNNLLDMFSEMRSAALLAKGVSGDASALPAAGALSMATIAGARALGLERHIGSIEPGKLADLACVDLGTPNSQPVYDVVSQLVYATRADQVADVWVGGRHLLDDGRFTRLDPAAAGARADEWRARIASASAIQ
ncbi:MAG: TRZ/ATZ family hydrolase [Proteobacteria bacterium]|nr:TRZ/ATZ family hydrolase [Pseudomonadota bacterium]